MSRLVTLTGLYIWTFLAQMRSDIKVSASYLWAAFAIFCATAKKNLHGWQSRKNKSYATQQQLQNVPQQLFFFFFSGKNPSRAAQLSCEFLIINNPERCFAAVGLWHLQLAPSFHSTAACFANKRSSVIRRHKGNILPIIILQTYRWRVAWNGGCSVPGESIHFRTDTHSVGNMSNDRWAETQLIMFLKNWPWLWSVMMDRSHDCINDSPNISTSVELLFSLSSFVSGSRTNTTSGSAVPASTPAYFCFVLPPAVRKKPTRQRALKRTDIARQTRWACRDPPKKNTLKRFFWTPSSSCRPSVVVFALPPAKLPLLRRLCSALCGLPATKER